MFLSPDTVENMPPQLERKEEMQPAFMHQTDLDQMYDDIVKAAEIAEVPYDKDAIWSVLNAYGDFFSGSAISFVTSTRPAPQRGLSVRYVELGMPHDAYAIGLEQGLITRQEHSFDALLPEIQSKYTVLGYGVDLSAAHGLAKIWVFLRDLPPVEDLCATLAVPDSVKNHLDYYAQYGLKHVSLFAFDFRSRTINIYFMVKRPGLFPPDKVAGMIGDLGFAVPTPEVLEHCSRAVTIYYTFRWDSPQIERACFGTITPDPSLIPTHWHPLLERYVAQVPCLSERRVFIYSITPARSGDYIKIENDYTGSMTELMRGGAQAVPS
jgi:hypothetical protein